MQKSVSSQKSNVGPFRTHVPQRNGASYFAEQATAKVETGAWVHTKRSERSEENRTQIPGYILKSEGNEGFDNRTFQILNCGDAILDTFLTDLSHLKWKLMV